MMSLLLIHFFLCFFYIQNQCSRDPRFNGQIKSLWESKATERYSDFVHKLKIVRDRPDFIPEDEWPEWLQYWEELEVKKKSEIASKNRQTEVAGPGTGMSRHTGGSKSTIEHARDLVTFLTLKHLNI